MERERVAVLGVFSERSFLSGVLQPQQSALLVAGVVTDDTSEGKDAQHFKPFAIGAIRMLVWL